MSQNAGTIKQEFIDGLSSMSQFWGFPRGMGAIFAVLYLSPRPLSLDQLVEQTGLTKGAISTNVRALARLGLVYRSSQMGDRKDYYEAEADFYKAIRSILRERQNSEFDRAVASVDTALQRVESGQAAFEPEERSFLLERLRTLQAFFASIDNLVRAVTTLENLGVTTIEKIINLLR